MAVPWPRQRPAANGEAFIRSLHHEHGRALLAFANRLTGDYGAAEDVVQETLVRAWKNAGTLSRADGAIRGWLFTVARNLVTDRFRAQAVRPVEVAESPTCVPVEGDHSQRVVDSMVALAALDSLTEEHRDVLVQLYILGRSVTETAEVLGIPAGTVKSRSHYALRSLRHRVGHVPAALNGARP